MPEFLRLKTPDIALQALLQHFHPQVVQEVAALEAALGRVTAAPVIAGHPLPAFTRSSVDGYAVRAADTYGASDSQPAYLQVAGEVPMGASAAIDLLPGQAALIHTGGMLPAAADAVVMVEYTQAVGAAQVEILRAAAVGENVLQMGEDVAAGQVVIPAGRRIRPAEIGGLAALGVVNVPVARQPAIGILSSGDEVVPPAATPQPGQVRDANSYSLSALVEQAGGRAVRYGILPDRAEAMMAAAERAMKECDVVVFTAGSSASARDLTAVIIARLGPPGILVHGVSVRPGKPTILAVCNGKVVIGLPGNPVSALVIAGLFLRSVIESLLGLPLERPRPALAARLTTNLPSLAGREDYVAVRLLLTPQGYQAEPIFSKSNLIFSLARADGLVCVPQDANGLAADELVTVELLI